MSEQPPEQQTRIEPLLDEGSTPAAKPGEGAAAPAPPTPFVGPESDEWPELKKTLGWGEEKIELYESVYAALFALPFYFTTSLNLTGILATDIHTFNTPLGATIENQIVEALNEHRRLWDPDNKYLDHRFVRQAQRFPDVILRPASPGKAGDVLLGIELKGWYALAKEGEPSFRFTATRDVCAPWDLLAVYPWALSEVISGTPRLLQPFVTGARYAAERRNYYWQHEKKTKQDRGITISSVNRYYPVKSDPISDMPAADEDNFGRVARYGIMKTFLEALGGDEKLSGIPLGAWQGFLTIFREDKGEEVIASELANLAKKYSQENSTLSSEDLETISHHVSGLLKVFQDARTRVPAKASSKSSKARSKKPSGNSSEPEEAS